MKIRIAQVYRPNSSTAVNIQIVDYDGPGFYIVRSQYGDGPTWSMSGDVILSDYTLVPDAIVY